MAFAKQKQEAIRNFCLQCVGNSPREVRLCPSKKCPLFPFRMGSIKKAIEIDKIDYVSLFTGEKVQSVTDFSKIFNTDNDDEIEVEDNE